MTTPKQKKKILIIEDDSTFSLMVRDALVRKSEVFEVFVEADGVKGLAAALREKPSVILLDMILPGLKGEEILNELRSHDATKNIPVFVLSQRSDQDAVAEGVFHKVKGYFVKSDMSIDTIVEKVVSAVEE